MFSLKSTNLPSFIVTGTYNYSKQSNMVGLRKVFVIGAGMTKFVKPGSVPNFDYPEMMKESITKALQDARLTYGDMQQAVVSYIYGASTCGQRGLYEMGMTGIPVYNVNNNCASGSTALLLGKQIIESGRADCVLVVGFEKMKTGSLENMGTLDDRANPIEKLVQVAAETYGLEPHPITAQLFGNAGREHNERYGSTPHHLAKIGWKNHKHSTKNPLSQFQKEYSMKEVLESKMIHAPLTKLQCSPTSDGSAAAILCSEDFLRSDKCRAAREHAVEMLGMAMRTDLEGAFTEKSNIKMVGFDMAQAAANAVYKETGLSINDVQVIELHDCFSANELITYEALGMCPVGKAHTIVDNDDNTYGGRWVVNPSGGLISKGHPIGATGVAQCVELCRHLRGEVGDRQVPNARVALQHNVGLGGACVVGMYRLAAGARSKATLGVTAAPSTNAGGSFKSDPLFTAMQSLLATHPSKYTSIGASYAFVIKGGPDSSAKTWSVDLKSSKPSIAAHKGEQDTTGAECVLTVSDSDMASIAEGKLNVQQAFISGKLKLKGNLAKAMKLRDLFDSVGKSAAAKL